MCGSRSHPRIPRIYSWEYVKNGSLLDEEKVKYFNDNKFGLGISWDGRNSEKSREADVFKTNWNNIRQLNRFNTVGVISSQNYIKDYLDDNLQYEEDYKKLHGKYYSIATEFISNMCNNCQDFINFDYDKLQAQMTELLNNYDPSVENIYNNYITKTLKHFDWSYSKNADLTFTHSRCMGGIKNINIDMAGNMYLCHNSYKEKIGTYKDSDLELICKTVCLDKTYKQMTETDCKNCNFKSLCRGGCLIQKREQMVPYYCDLMKAFWTPVIEYRKTTSTNTNADKK